MEQAQAVFELGVIMALFSGTAEIVGRPHEITTNELPARKDNSILKLGIRVAPVGS
jgi:hypothetical protein